jgi:hypothetical protein
MPPQGKTKAGEMTGEELICSITEHATVEELELFFIRLSNHVGSFRAERKLTDQQLERLLDHIKTAIHDRIGSLRDPDAVKRRFHQAFDNLRKIGGPPTFFIN